MKVDPLPPIPSSPQHHWRQFRVKALPFVTFGIVLGCAVWLWGNNLANPLVMGQAEGLQSVITSPVPGLVARIHASLYQEVKAGDIIAQVDAADPQVLSNTVSLIRARMDAIRAGAGFDSGDRVRFAQFQMDWLAQRSDLVSLRADLQYSEAELTRVQGLAKEGISSQSELDVTKRDVDRLNRAIQEKSASVDAAEKAFRQLDPGSPGNEPATVRAELAVAAEELRLAEAQLQPVTLRAPISGRIIKLEIQPQGTVIRGAIIAAIASPHVDRIVGYIPQPVRLDPSVGMKVEVRTRSTMRQVGQSEISHVGPRIELFDAPLRIRGMGAAQERGLPIIVTLPPNMNLRPGELVDLRIVPNQEPASVTRN